MKSILVLLSLSSILLILAGLISPKLVIRWGNPEKRTRKRVFLVYGLLFIVSIFLLSTYVDDAAPTASKTPTVNNNSQAESPAIAANEQAASSIVKYITNQQVMNLQEGMKYDDFVKMLGGEGELVYDRHGVKTYLFLLEGTKDTEIRVGFNNGVLLTYVNSAELDDEINTDSTNTSQDNSDDSTLGDMVDSVVSQGKKLLSGNDPIVQGIRGGTIGEYQDVTIGDAFDFFFENAAWYSFEAETGQTVVEFSGNCLYADAEVKAMLQFIISDDNTSFEIGALSFNDVPQTEFVKAALLSAVYESYYNKN